MNSAQIILALYAFVLGLCIGSFSNVAILRGLSGENLVFARSKCPRCNKTLKWYMNIPLISYIFLKGKCAYCAKPISFQYPLVEFICGLGFLFSYLAFGFSCKTLFVCAFLTLFIIMSATDYKETVIIDIHAYILAILGLVYSALNLGEINWIQSIIGAVFGFVIFEILARSGYLFIKQRIFGEGDSLIALGLGAIFGFKSLVLVIILSFLIQTLSAIPVLIKKSLDNNRKKLAFSYVITIFSIIALFCNNYFSLIKNSNTYLVFAIIVSIFLILSLKEIISDIKNKKEDKNSLCLMPFGPALLISGALCLFYLAEIKSIVIKLFL